MKIAVLASTKGTDLQGLIDNFIKIDKVICNKRCLALDRAKVNKIVAIYLPKGEENREEYDQKLAAHLEGMNLILLIGWMRLLSPWFVDKFRGKIVNVHPSLLPAFAGGMDKNVHQEVLKAGCKVSGCTVHLVDETVDGGRILIQRTVKIADNETVDSLKDKVQKEEVLALLEVINNYKKYFG